MLARPVPQPPALGGDPKIQVMGRVWHLLDGNVSAVLNSVGRELPDYTPLISLDDHRAHLAPLQAEIVRLQEEIDGIGGLKEKLRAMTFARDLFQTDFAKLKGRCDELEREKRNMHRELHALVSEGYTNPDASDFGVALSKPAGSEQ